MAAKSPRSRFLYNLASAFLAAEWSAKTLRLNARRAIGMSPRWIAPLVRRVLKHFPEKPAFDQLIDFVSNDRTVRRRLVGSLPVRTLFLPQPTMAPPPASAGVVEIPQLATEGSLAEWFGISVGKLLWYADTSGRNRKHPAGPLRPYRYCWIAKPGGRIRLLEIPNWGLKRIQRKLLTGLLYRIPPHPAAHGFRPGRSIVTNAGPHCNKKIVLRFDLVDFFASVRAARVYHIFRTFGYPERISQLFTGLCTTALPIDVWQSRPNPSTDGSDHGTWKRLATRHLPQGAPTSPVIANLAAFRLDRRLSKLATVFGADYTRYADDLTFSGGDDLARGLKRFVILVGKIALDEGFHLNHRKTRIMTCGGRQLVTGVVVNTKPNVQRAKYDQIKAILTNCIRHGPVSQNRTNHPEFQAHLFGRIAYLAAINPRKGRKLRMLFDRIAWPIPPRAESAPR